MATSALSRTAVVLPKKGCNSGEPDRGASRIPCPPPVAIGPCSPLPGAVPFIPFVTGLDKLFVSFWLKGEGFDEFRRRLQEFKDEFNDEHLCGPEVSERSFDLGWQGMSFNMSRTGAKKSPYKLTSGDIVLLFSNHQHTASYPNCRIEIHSMSCWNPGWKAVLDRFFALLEQLGCSVHREVPTEYHLAADLIGVDYTRTSLINQRRWIVKAPKKISPTYEFYKPNYISFGKGDFMFRCYDKTTELKHDAVKRDFFYNVWFDRLCYVPEHVTRIEFQIRRAVSKELQINTVEDLESNLDAIWEYCVGSPDPVGQKGWARFCNRNISEKDRENKHHNRYSTAFLWEFIRSVRFGNGRTDVPPIERKKLPPQYNREQSLKQARGCLLSVCAVDGLHPDDVDGHFSYAMNLFYTCLMDSYKTDRKEYVRKIKTKRTASINTFFAELYDDNPYNRGECFLKDVDNYSHKRALALGFEQ